MARYPRLWDPYDFRDPRAFISVLDGQEGVVLARTEGRGVSAVAIRPGLAEMFDADLEDRNGRLPHEPGYRPFRVVEGGPDATPVVPIRRRARTKSAA